VAVKFTGLPADAGFCEDERVVVLVYAPALALVLVMVSERAPEVLAAKAESPLYAAVME
jgi:hypothetical protein